MNRIELLAPAGSLPILKAAVDSGADAVYCGVNLYNARINADTTTVPVPAQKSTLSMISMQGSVLRPTAPKESLKTSMYTANAGIADISERKRLFVPIKAEAT